MKLTRDIHLSETDKEIILNQVQAMHKTRDREGVFQAVESLEVVMSERPSGKYNTMSELNALHLPTFSGISNF